MKRSVISHFHYYALLVGAFLQSVAFSALADCDLIQCSYSVSLDKAGFYIPSVKLPATSKEGFWGLSLGTPTGLNEGGFNAGGVLGENATYPGFIGFYLTRAGPVNISAYEYTGKIKELTVSISDTNKNFVFSPTAFKPTGEARYSPVLEPGFYAATVYSKSGDPRGRFGISLLGNSFGGGVNVGGWIDSYTGGSGEGFGGIYVSSPQTVSLKVLFGNSYGSAGAGQPSVEVYRQEPTGVRVLQWSSANADAQVIAQLQKLPGTWKFLANSYSENTIKLTTIDSSGLVVRGTDSASSPVYVKYNTSKEKFYLYSDSGNAVFWFHFASDNAVIGCTTSYWNEDYDNDCSLGGTRIANANTTACPASFSPEVFQGRTGKVAFFNEWSSPVTVVLYHPNSGGIYGRYTVSPGQNNVLGSELYFGDDWGVCFENKPNFSGIVNNLGGIADYIPNEPNCGCTLFMIQNPRIH